MANGVMISSTNYHWHAVYTRAKMEKKAYRELKEKGIACYLPLISVRKHWGKQSQLVEELLISGYVFVRVSHREFYEVLFVPGILGYICFDGIPAIITDRQMDCLRLLTQSYQDNILVTSERIDKGSLVRIIDGPLKNLCAEVVDIRGKTRILLRLAKLGCCVHVELGTTRVMMIEHDKSSKATNQSGLVSYP